MSSTKVTVSKGTRKFTATRQLGKASRSVTQSILSEITGKWAQKKFEEIAKAEYQLVAELARANFSAMVEGMSDLVENSQVPAEYEPSTPTPIFKNKKYNVKTKKSPTQGTVSATIRITKYLLYSSNLPKLLKLTKSKKVASTVHIEFPVKWNKLTEPYFKRKIQSTQFYFKRIDEKSERLKFKKQVASWKGKVSAISTYKKRPLKFNYDKNQGVLTSQFVISYPALPPAYEFIRQAYLSGMKSTSVGSGLNQFDKLQNYERSGIIYAENRRPMLRPFAVLMGRNFKQQLKMLK